MGKIEYKDNQLQIPNTVSIPFIEGDGTGPDIWNASKKVFDTAVEKAYSGERKIEWLEVFAGEKSFNKSGEWLPKETLDIFREYLVGIKGPLTTPVGGGIRSLNVALRQELDLFVCLRPVEYFDGVPSPVRRPELVDMVIFRENTEDIYAGIEFQTGTEGNAKLMEFLQKDLGVTNIRFPETTSLGVKPVSTEGTERLVKAAIDYALKYDLPSVTLVHKGNIMKFTEGSFKKWGYEIAEKDYPGKVFTWLEWEKIKAEHGQEKAMQAMNQAQKEGKLIIKDVIADAFLQNILLHPADYSVVATLNLNGDYVSDALAAMVGGIGIAPGANINYNTGHAIFEATHGTAPNLANLNKANPSSVILSGAMMFEYMGWTKVSQLIKYGVSQAIKSKKVTIDFHQQMKDSQLKSTSEFADEIIKHICNA